jgi:hypothetical protein
MKDRILRAVIAFMALGLAWGIWPVDEAFAGLDIDLAGTLKVGDDSDVFLSVSARYFRQDRNDIEELNGRCRNPDDLAVLLFLSRRTGESPALILKLRREGLSWWKIGQQLGVNVEIWFVPVKRDPGPPYGKAYGHWREHRKDKHYVMNLSDGDIRNLVAVRMLHEYYGVEAEVAMQWRSSGQDLRSLTAGEYQTRHGKAHSGDKSAEKGNKGKRKAHGR